METNTFEVCDGLEKPAGPLIISYTITPLPPLEVTVIVPFELQVEGVEDKVMVN
jgi:hypothetical protein